MLLKKNILFFFFMFFFLFPYISQAQNDSFFIVAPACLIQNAKQNFHVLTRKNDFFLLEINSNELHQLMIAKKNQTQICGGFMDVSEEWSQYKNKTNPDVFLLQQTALRKSHFSAAGPQHEKEVNQLIKQLNSQLLLNNLTYLSNFRDRYANSDTGTETAAWLKSQVEKLAQDNHRNDVSVYYVQTGSNYKQPSVVAKVGTANESGIVIGAHMDTLSSRISKKPGADDDGSGTVTVLEAARLVLESGLHFKKPIYFIWYAAEEEGLVGSNYVVNHFKSNHIPVQAVLHFDMTGYTYRTDPSVWLITDYVNKDLNTYLEMLIQVYVKQPIKYTRCGYACSDHASWTKNGFAAAIPAETAFRDTNPAMHTSGDTIDKLLLNHMIDYAKLGIAFVIELAEPV